MKTKSKRSPGIRALRWGGLAIAAVGINVATGSYSAYVNGEQSHERYMTLRAVNDAGWVCWGVGTLMHLISWLVGPERERTPSAPTPTFERRQAQLPSVRF